MKTLGRCLLFLVLTLLFWRVGIALGTLRPHEVWGYDFATYAGNFRDWRFIGYFPFRHPFLGVLMSPVIVLGHFIHCGSSWAYVDFLHGFFAVVAAAQIFLLWKILRERMELSIWRAAIPLAIFLWFDSVWVLAAVPESFGLSMLALTASLWWLTRPERDLPAGRYWISAAVLAGLCGGITLTNGVKVLLAALIARRPTRIALRRCLLAVLALGSAGVAFFFVRMAIWNFSHPDAPKSVLTAFSQTLNWAATGIPFSLRLRYIFGSFFGEPLIAHGVGLGVSRIAVPYDSWWKPVCLIMIYAWTLFGAWRGRHHPLVRALVAMFSVDALLHLVVGWGLEEGQIFCGHWFFSLPLLMGFALKRHSRVRRGQDDGKKGDESNSCGRSMNVLVLSLIFSPDNVSTAQIMAGVAEDLKRAGHTVKVLTTTPHFHRDPSMEAVQPMRNRLGPLLKQSSYHGIPVYHVAMPDKSIWPPLRMLSWIWFHFVSVLMAPFLGKTDVVLACSPPLTIGLAAWAMCKLTGARYIYNVQELYPDIAVNLGKMKGRAVISFFQRVERFIYRHAAAVTSITEGMCAKIRTRTDPDRVHLIPNFVEIAEVPARVPQAPHPLTLCYAGNMGVPQYLGVMIEAAKLLAAERDFTQDFRVLFVGGGQDEMRLRECAEKSGLEVLLPGAVHPSSRIWIEFRGYRPISEMPGVYAESDLFYVGQDPKAASDGIPSKIYRILGQKKPLAVMTAEGSDLERFVRESGGGFAVRDAEDLARILVQHAHGADAEDFARMGARGYEHVRTFFSREHVSMQYVKLVQSLE